MANAIQIVWNDYETPDRTKHIASLRDKLIARLGDGARVIIDESNRRVYSRDLADLPQFIERAFFRTTPLIVVQPRDANEIALVLQLANEENIPVFPRGVASSAYGGPVPTTNGIVLDLSPLQKMDAPNWNDQTILVDAGARWGDVDDMLARYNLALYTYPSNRLATIAGWIAGGGYGLNSFKYGHVSRHVAALELVTPRGEVKTVRDNDADFEKYFGTEGLMGIVARVKLRVREKAHHAIPHLLHFESDAEAFAFVQELAVRNIIPASVGFYDTHLLHLLNEHHHLEHGANSNGALLPEKPSLLIFIDDADTEQRLNQTIALSPFHPTELPCHIAGYLWSDRFFPMKIRALGPSLLAAEAVLPLDTIAAFLPRTRELAKRFGLEPATECHILSTPDGFRALVMPMFLTDIRKFSYALHLAFVSVLDRAASRFGGRPYNLGIWHAPFADVRNDAKILRGLREFKRAQDPRNILNPRKFFRVQSRFAGIPGLIFHPIVFKFVIDVLTLVSNFTFHLLRLTPDHATMRPRDIERPQLEFGLPAAYDTNALMRTATECTSCGACVSVCPAYVHTKDERVTGRAKMWLARKLANGDRIAQIEAEAAWLCVRCRACAEVCQDQLPLMTAYEKLEAELQARFGRPDQLIEEFVAEMERDPEYRTKVGLSLPVELTEQRWQKLSRPSTVNGQPPSHPLTQPPSVILEPDESFDLPEPAHTHGGKYHIAAKLAPPRQNLPGKFAIDRNDQCISCGQCVEACIYGVHLRNPLDIRRMNAPKDELCRACFRCIQECPRNALTISFDGEYAHAGRGAFTADVISSLQRQADEGKIPVLGAGYRGAFAGIAFDSMWTDMSEIVRPTRDGIHGREYISTAVDLGRRPTKLEIGDWRFVRNKVEGLGLPPFIEIPLPILFNDLPIHKSRNVLLATARAARQLGTYAIVSRADWFDELRPYARHLALSVTAKDLNDFVAHFPLVEIADTALLSRVKTLAPNVLVILRTDPNRLDEIVALAREGAEIIHVAFDPIDPMPLFEQLPRLHARLVEEGLRDAVTLIASGAMAMAEHIPKTILLGADAIAIDLPLVVALECVLADKCFGDGRCTREIENIDPAWGEQRIVNLAAAWRNQLLEVMGAMGMREVRRLRGERGRAMMKSELDEKLFAPIFAE